MPLHLHDTARREKVPFVPADPQRVTLYVCGPTVYNYAHIGNARAAVVFDLLYRVLCARYGKDHVLYCRNITDVDDKINLAARERGVEIGRITEEYTAAYHADMAALGVLPPVVEPRVTDNLPGIISLIERLLAAGNAYEAEGHVLFNVPSYPDYGRFSGRNRDEQVAGARVDVAPYKRDPADFVLWKPSPPDLPGWDSPWGRGRPGWHIECSAMVERYLGETIDLHGGGQDLVFPHHENEVAQGTCAHGGASYCRHWVHNGFVTVDQEKMSKSIGNVLLVRDLLGEAPGEAIRYALLATHYRHPLNWSDEGLCQARAALDRLYGALKRCEAVAVAGADLLPPAAFAEALEDDLNTPQALSVLFQVARALNSTEDPAEQRRLKGQLLAAGAELGLLGQAPKAWLGVGQEGARIQSLVAALKAAQEAGDPVLADSLHRELNQDAEIQGLLAERIAARQAKDFARADAIRDQLEQGHGILLMDSPEGTECRVRQNVTAMAKGVKKARQRYTSVAKGVKAAGGVGAEEPAVGAEIGSDLPP
jgi:cysteinyl-tRNA synthetase